LIPIHGHLFVCGQLRMSQTIKVRHRQLMSATLLALLRSCIAVAKL
jgi:hypothetical protein